MSASSNRISASYASLRAFACAAVLLPMPLALAAVRHAAASNAAGHAAGLGNASSQKAHGARRPTDKPHAAATRVSQRHGTAAVEVSLRSRKMPPVATHFATRTHAQAGKPVARESAHTATIGPRRTRATSRLSAKTSPRLSAAAEPATVPVSQPAIRSAADRAAEDRVRAWYKTLHSGYAAVPQEPELPETANATKTADAGAALEQRSAAKQMEKSTGAAKLAKPVPVTLAPPATQPDLPPKPAVVEIDRAAQRQAEANHTTAISQARTSTSDDAAAIAEESHIPSTAPTERVASPFTHGDFLVSTPGAPSGTQHAAIQAAAPILRASSPAASALIATAAKKPKLDPAVMGGMTEDTFAGDETPSTTARAAINLAGSTAKADPMARPALAPVDENTANTASLVKVNLSDGAGRLILMPPMKGTHEILVHQNQMAVSDGLERIQNDDQLLAMRRAKELVALPETDGIGVDERLPPNRRYARSWTVHFLNDLSRAHYARFHSPLIVTSAARTVAFQRHLVLTNGNAAPPSGDVASPHLYGQAVDIAKHGMSVTEIAWMRAYLTPVETEGKIDVEEEFQQACFHVSVYRRYMGLPSRQVPTQEVAPARKLEQVKATPLPSRHRHLPTALLATGLR